MALRPDLKRYLEYIRNTGESVSIAQFDDDHEPIGSMVRAELIPEYVAEDDSGILKLTDLGKQELDA